MTIEIAAISKRERQAMLMDGTLLALRLFGDDGQEVEDPDQSTKIVVVDHRTTPPTFYSIPEADIEYSGAA